MFEGDAFAVRQVMTWFICGCVFASICFTLVEMINDYEEARVAQQKTHTHTSTEITGTEIANALGFGFALYANALEQLCRDRIVCVSAISWTTLCV